jgi:hypothetical protein
MPDTLLRQWAMLRLIPRAPRKIEATRLEPRKSSYPLRCLT